MRSFTNIFLIGFVLVSLGACQSNSKTTVRIGVAANTQFVVQEMIDSFEGLHNNITIHPVISSTGKLVAQIQEGAPIELLIAADTAYPNYLYQNQLSEKPEIYASGILVYYQNNEQDKIAMADPKTAPYGRLAMAYLQHSGLYDSLKSQIIYGESIGQVNHYIQTGAVGSGYTCQSILFNPNFKNQGKVEWLKDFMQLQSMVLVNGHSADAAEFYNFVLSPQGQAILSKHGYQENH